MPYLGIGLKPALSKLYQKAIFGGNMKDSIIQQHTKSYLFRAVVFLICILSYLKSNAQEIPFTVATANGQVEVSKRIQMLGVLFKEYNEIARLQVVPEARIENYRRMVEFLYENRPTPYAMSWHGRYMSKQDAELATNLNKVEFIIKTMFENRASFRKTGEIDYLKFVTTSALERLPADLQGRIEKQYAAFAESNMKPSKIHELRLKVKAKAPKGLAGILALVAAGFASAGQDDAETKTTVGAGAGSGSSSTNVRVTVDDDDFGPISDTRAPAKTVRAAQ